MYASSSILGVLLNHLILQDSVINYLSQQILWSQHSDYNSVLVTYCVNYVLRVANDKCCLWTFGIKVALTCGKSEIIEP